MRARPLARRTRRRRLLGVLTLVVPSLFVFAASGPAAAGGNSTTTITGSFGDSCRDFAAHSGKDISHVVIRYADGRVIKDETIASHDFAIDGSSGGEIVVAVVKSGTTSQTFTCQPTTNPPTAILEIQTPPLEGCVFFPFPEYPTCLATDPRTDWSTLPGSEIAFIFIAPYPPATFSFRGTGSSDPDGDLATWSIDFGDGTSTSGTWTTEPPTDVSHTFPSFLTNSTVTLTVTDASGASDSSSITFFNHDGTPD